MFDELRGAKRAVQAVAQQLRPEELTPAEAAETIRQAAAIERHAAGIRLRCSKRIDDEDLLDRAGKRDAADWLAGETGQAASDARKDLEASKRLDQLPATTRRSGTASSHRPRPTR